MGKKTHNPVRYDPMRHIPDGSMRYSVMAGSGFNWHQPGFEKCRPIEFAKALDQRA